MARIDNLSNFLLDVANSIRTKKGTSDLIEIANFDTEILSIPSGGGEVVSKDVNFYDYDGTLLYSYTKEEFLALEALPNNPTHAGLTFQQCTYTLQQAQTYVTKYTYLDIGFIYKPTDNKTKLYVDLDEDTLKPTVGLYVNGSVTVDWGDGTTDTITGTNMTTLRTAEHTYSAAGSYVVSLDSGSDSLRFAIAGSSSSYANTLLFRDKTSQYNHSYAQSIKKVELGTNVNLDTYIFNKCSNLESIVIPEGVIISGVSSTFQYQFANCMSLRHLTLPSTITFLHSYCVSNNYNFKTLCFSANSITSLGANVLVYCGLTRLTLPTSVTTIDIQAFNYNNNLEVMIIPDSVTSLGKNAVRSDFNLKHLYLSSLISAIDSYSMYDCRMLEHLTLPSALTTLGSYCFNYCSELKEITLPVGITVITQACFSSCVNLRTVTILGDVTQVEASAFGSTGSIRIIDFTHCTAVPTLDNRNAFGQLNNLCKIIVPDALYDDWIVATNWSYSSIVNKIVKESEA